MGEHPVDEITKRLDEIKAEVAVISKSDEFDAAQKREKLMALKTERDALLAEKATIEENEKLAAELTADPEPAAEESADEAPAEEAAPEAPAEEAAPAAPADAADPVAEAEAATAEAAVEEPAPEAIAAAVSGVQSDATVTDETSPARRRVAITASSTTAGLSRGAEMTVGDWTSLHKHAARTGEGTVQKFASIERNLGDGPVVSDRNTPLQNSVIMASAGMGAEDIAPISAAACYCGPFETMKDITTIGLDDRPVLGLFRTVPVTGPFNYIRELNVADVAAGVTQWECTDQDAVDPAVQATWKPCVDLDCATPTQVDPYSIVACGKHDIFQQLSHPELIDDFIAKLGIRYARLAEQLLLDQILADSTVLTYAATNLGLLWELEVVLGHLTGLASYGQRIRWSDYALILPPGLMEAIIADEHVRGFSRGANRSDIMAQLRELGVGQIVESLDVNSTAEAQYLAAIGAYVSPGGTVAFDPNTAIGTYDIHVVPLSSYTVGQSTLVDAGFTRDADLIRQNKVQYFVEGAEFIEKMNDVPSFTIRLTGYGNGGRSALATPDITEA